MTPIIKISLIANSSIHGKDALRAAPRQLQADARQYIKKTTKSPQQQIRICHGRKNVTFARDERRQQNDMCSSIINTSQQSN